MKPDCLLLVEYKNTQEIGIIKNHLEKTLSEVFSIVRAHRPSSIEPFYKTRIRSDDKGTKNSLTLTSMVLATSLLDNGVKFKLYEDENIIEKYHAAIEGHIRNSTEYVCLSTTFIQNIVDLEKMVHSIHEIDKKNSVKIIIGGPMLFLWGTRIIEKLDDVFCYCYGDMDYDFGFILSNIIKYKNPEKYLQHNVHNKKEYFSYHAAVGNLNHLPIPRWESIEEIDINDNGFSINKSSSVIPVEERRGCVNKCAFCSYHTLKNRMMKSPERILQELMNIKAAGYSKVNFIGSEFFLPLSNCRNVLEKIINQNLSLEIMVFGRIDVLADNFDVIDLLADAGVSRIYFGAETGDENLLRGMNKKYRLDLIPHVVDALRKKNIDICASFILGFPGENEYSINKTIEYIIECNFSTLEFHALQVIPFTPLYNERKSYDLKVFGNSWKHSTMALNEIPQVFGRLISAIYSKCSSNLTHLDDLVEAHFFFKENARQAKESITRHVYKLIYDIFSRDGDDNVVAILDSWEELKTHLDYIV